MTCQLVQSLLDDYIDGDLSASQTGEIESHLAQCTACKQEYLRSAELRRLLSSRAAPDPGTQYFREVTELILARTVDQTESEQRTFRASADSSRIRAPFYRSLIAAAASIGLFVTSLYVGSIRPMTASAPPADTRMRQATSMVAMLHSDDNRVMTDAEKLRITSGMVLLGPPGMVGRCADVAAVLGDK
jgi:anti-sigma factor RsiW